MHVASVGVSKFCFLLSLAFCGLLLMLIPALQPQAPQLDLPQPRPQSRRAQVTSRPDGVSAAADRKSDAATALNGSSVGQNEPHQGGRDSDRSPDKGADAGGKAGEPSGSRSRDPLELKDIFIAVKTTKKYHRSRLELLIQTWVSKARAQVSGGHDPNVTVLYLSLDTDRASCLWN